MEKMKAGWGGKKSCVMFAAAKPLQVGERVKTIDSILGDGSTLPSDAGGLYAAKLTAKTIEPHRPRRKGSIPCVPPCVRPIIGAPNTDRIGNSLVRDAFSRRSRRSSILRSIRNGGGFASAPLADWKRIPAAKAMRSLRKFTNPHPNGIEPVAPTGSTNS